MRIAFLTGTTIVFVLLAVAACSRINIPIPATATPTPTLTPTPTPTPTPATPPTATPAPEVKLSPVSDFTAHLNGLTVEGSFKVGEEPVTFAYRPDHVEANEASLRVSGTLTYTLLDRTSTLSDLGAVLTPVGDTCDKIGLATDPVELSQFGVTIPSQKLELDLTVLDQTSAGVPAQMVCRATRLVVEQAGNPLTRLLINQINRLLQP